MDKLGKNSDMRDIIYAVNHLMTRIDEVRSAVKKLNEDLTTVSTTLHQIEKARELNDQSHDERINQLKKDVSKIGKYVKELSKRLQTVEQNLTSYSQQLQSLQQDLASLEPDIEQLGNKIDHLRDTVSDKITKLVMWILSALLGLAGLLKLLSMLQ